jgi:dTDP-4-dehydrorhamnose reductase
MKKILVTGASGLLGANLLFAYRDKYAVHGVYNLHPLSIANTKCVPLDLLQGQAVAHLLRAVNPDVVIHCAALTDIDLCETNNELAQQLNIGITRNIQKSLHNTRTQLIYISTDAVYDGRAGNFAEDQTNPINYYGHTKLLGEKAALLHPNTLVLRTNIFGWNVQHKFSLAEWIIDSLQHKKTIQGFQDVIFSSLYTTILAEVIEGLIEKNVTGIFNVGSADSMSKYDFAVRIAQMFKLDASLVNKASVDSRKFSAPRGKNLSLNVSKVMTALDKPLSSIEDSLVAFHRDHNDGFRDKLRGIAS